MQPEDQDKLREFNEQWDKAHTSDTPVPAGNPQNGNVVQNTEGVGLAEQIATAKANLNPTGTYVPPQIPTTGDTCDQCGTMHPPVRPGETCPIAKANGKENDSTSNPAPIPDQGTSDEKPPVEVTTTIEEKPAPVQPVKPVIVDDPGPKHIIPPEATVKPEPEPLAENNIPTEIHVNKYLQHWGQIIEAHCKAHNIVNVKRLMRHLTIEVTDFLELNKGR